MFSMKRQLVLELGTRATLRLDQSFAVLVHFWGLAEVGLFYFIIFLSIIVFQSGNVF